jgi:predicted RNA-binding Zn-ribbon protein involved in translation (DUF1610 family)
MAGMSTYPFQCDLCGGVTDAPTYGDFNCQHCGQAYVYDECHRIELSEPQLKTLRDSRWILVSERLPEKNEPVCVVCGGKVTVGTYSPMMDDWWALVLPVTGIQPTDNVTHWMPLPEPPTE